PRDGPERARQNRRDHWYPEDRQIWVQQAQGTFVAHAGDGRAPVYPLLQSQQTDAGPGTGRQVRRRGMRTDRTDSPATVERQGGGQEAPMTFKGVLRPALNTKLCRLIIISSNSSLDGLSSLSGGHIVYILCIHLCRVLILRRNP